MSSQKKGLGPIGLLALVALVVGGIAVAAYSLQYFDILDLPIGDETLGLSIFVLVLAAPAAAAALGFLASKGSGAKSKCLGIALGGVVLLAYIGWIIVMDPAKTI